MRARVAGRSLFKRGFYWFSKTLLKYALTAYVGTRYFNVPDLRKMEGGLLIASNHQSFLDPVLVGMSFSRPISYMARRSLFRIPGLGLFLRLVGVHPIRRGEVDSSALRLILKLLRGGETLLMFPEGTRTPDGELGEFKAGVVSLALRTRVPILPVCVEGAFESWPRSRVLPRPSRVVIAYGELIVPGDEKPEQLNERIRKEVGKLQADLRRALGRPQGRLLDVASGEAGGV